MHPGDFILHLEDLDLIKNGKPRLGYAQSYFTHADHDLGDREEQDLLTGLYCHWRDLPEYLVFEAEHQHTHEKQWRGGLMSKRGNARYRKNLDKRLAFIHRCTDRAVFARGALHCARLLASANPGRYTIADLLSDGAPGGPGGAQESEKSI